MTGHPRVVVIGGGVTGTGIARDLAMRGAAVTLLERDRLAEGTTGRMHGLLHSGARYAVSDPDSARQCIAENGILREIAGHCIEDTGGMFVSLASDDSSYYEEKRAACRDAGIPTREIDAETARELEPALSGTVERAFLVPDAAIDPFRLVAANAASAEAHGATILTDTEVVDLVLEDGRVQGVEVVDEDGTRTAIAADHVVNAAGPWVADVVSSVDADLTIPLSPSKGAMAVTNSRPVDTVINRCRPTAEGDILVPHETTGILGTTDVPVTDPDAVEETRAEVDRLLEEISAMVPVVADARLIRTYWGVRPLYDPGAGAGESDGGRDYAVLDHEERDDLPGLTSVLGGKLTTYRLMAADVADQVASRLGIEAECRTATEPLPGSEEAVDVISIMDRFDLRSPIARRTADRLGDRTTEVLSEAASPSNPVVCECEGVTAAEVRDAIDAVGPDLGAVRMRTRATMGTCQGGFCSHRLAVELSRAADIETARREYEALVEERWRGQRFVLEGDQLAQAVVNRDVRNQVLNVRDSLRDEVVLPGEESPILAQYDRGGNRSGNDLTDGRSTRGEGSNHREGPDP